MKNNNILSKIKKFAEAHNLMFRDYRFDGIINNYEPSKYELLYPATFKVFRGFNNQKEIEEFLNDWDERDVYNWCY